MATNAYQLISILDNSLEVVVAADAFLIRHHQMQPDGVFFYVEICGLTLSGRHLSQTCSAPVPPAHPHLMPLDHTTNVHKGFVSD